MGEVTSSIISAQLSDLETFAHRNGTETSRERLIDAMHEMVYRIRNIQWAFDQYLRSAPK